jgi:hypothetical protein
MASERFKLKLTQFDLLIKWLRKPYIPLFERMIDFS